MRQRRDERMPTPAALVHLGPSRVPQRLDTELGEIKNLLTELQSIQRSFAHTSHSSALAPKLAALAHW